MGVGRSFAVTAKEDLIVANDDEHHAGRAGLKKEFRAEGASGLYVGEWCCEIRLRESRHERRHEQEDKQCALKFSVDHSCWQFLGYKYEPERCQRAWSTT